MNYGSNKKVGLISHSVLIKTLFAKGLDDKKCIIKDPNFYLENGNLTAVNFWLYLIQECFMFVLFLYQNLVGF